MTDIRRIGFIGLGNQGGPIAGHLIEAGYEVSLWARRPDVMESFRTAGAHVAGSPAEVAARSELVGVCVWDDDGVRDVLEREDGVLAGARPGTVVAIHSTTQPDTCVALASRAPNGVTVIDAPVSGGPDRSQEGTLLVMVGGPTETFARCRPAFAPFSSNILHLGDVGAGQMAKLINNALLTANLGMAAGAVSLGEQLGLDGDALLRVINLGSATSFAASVLEGGRRSRQAAEGALSYLDKDVDLIKRLAERSQLAAPPPFLWAAGAGVAELDRLSSG